jgi:hypothetical protein
MPRRRRFLLDTLSCHGNGHILLLYADALIDPRPTSPHEADGLQVPHPTGPDPVLVQLPAATTARGLSLTTTVGSR